MGSPSAVRLKTDITAYARSLGFERIGFTSADPLTSAGDSLQTWIDSGRAGEMTYMEKNAALRSRPQELLAGAKSVIGLAVNYYNPSSAPTPPGSGRVARYAWGKDYHNVLQKRLASLTRYIEALAPEARCKTYLDTGPLLERAVAQKAGLGFIGKNTMLITKGMGSWVFLASVVTTLDLLSDLPDNRTCGSCTLCIDACPTQALTEPYHLDARKCIAYLTIESKAPIPEALGSRMGDWAFGCDICQEVCPHNTRLPPTSIGDFRPDAGVGPFVDLARVLSLQNDQEFDTQFSRTPLKRTKRDGLQRNARVVQANQVQRPAP